jgi:glycine betaine/proline transport system ATP-binding protein
MTHALRFDRVDVLFAGGRPRMRERALRTALEATDRGTCRAEILETHDVVVAVHGATLDVPAGAITALVGPSGSGKSTLLRTANGLTPVTRGHVWMRDGAEEVDVAHCSPATLRQLRRRRVAMVFQQFSLFPTRTVRDNVAFGLELRGDTPPDRRRVVDQKLELVGLADWADRQVRELSGGMQQRVGLARALATDPDILLMDEPFSALDAVIRRKLQDDLRELQEQLHKTILFVTHDLEEAVWLGDRLAVMDGGRIVQVGTPEDVVSAPATPQVSELVSCMRPRAR